MAGPCRCRPCSGLLKPSALPYDTPPDPLNDIGNDASSQRRVDEREKQFSAMLSQKQALSVPGLNPKHVNILRKKGGKLRTERLIPIDITPQVIDTPKRSISSAYVEELDQQYATVPTYCCLVDARVGSEAEDRLQRAGLPERAG